MTNDNLERINFLANAIVEIVSEIEHADEPDVENRIQKLADAADTLSAVTHDEIGRQLDVSGAAAPLVEHTLWDSRIRRFAIACVSAQSPAKDGISLLIGSRFFRDVAHVDRRLEGWGEATDDAAKSDQLSA